MISPCKTACVAMTILLFAPGLARAHAMLERAEPRVGNTVSSPPREIRLVFSQALEGAFTSVSITDPSGRPAGGKARVNGTEITVPLKGAGPGVYRVNWKVLSKDTHVTEGSYSFTVGP
jgi:methionine-rich copper-binding protein CopC